MPQYKAVATGERAITNLIIYGTEINGDVFVMDHVNTKGEPGRTYDIYRRFPNGEYGMIGNHYVPTADDLPKEVTLTLRVKTTDPRAFVDAWLHTDGNAIVSFTNNVTVGAQLTYVKERD